MQPHLRRAERDQALALGLERGLALRADETGAGAHVEVHPVLDDLALGHALEEQSRARRRSGSTQRRTALGAVVVSCKPGGAYA